MMRGAQALAQHFCSQVCCAVLTAVRVTRSPGATFTSAPDTQVAGGTLCANDAFLMRHTAEAEVLAGIKRQMLSPAIQNEICRRVWAQLCKPAAKRVDHQARIDQLKTEIGKRKA